MIYRVVFYNRSLNVTWSAGVYATDSDQARAIGAILISRSNNYQVRPEQCHVIDIPGLSSDVMTTT